MQHDEPRLRDDVEVSHSDEKHHYVLPLTDDDAFTAFGSLEDALWSVSGVASSDTDDDVHSALIYTYRRLARIFNVAYDDVSHDNQYKLTTQGRLFREVNWFRDEGVPARTVTVEKTADELRLTYETGFHATEETIFLDAYTEEPEKQTIVHNCGKGIKSIHAPYRPSPFEKWRYGPSVQQFSFEQTGDGLRLGIATTPPNQPLIWPRLYSMLTVTGGPYANVTFSLDKQTSTVQFTSDYGES